MGQEAGWGAAIAMLSVGVPALLTSRHPHLWRRGWRKAALPWLPLIVGAVAGWLSGEGVLFGASTAFVAERGWKLQHDHGAPVDRWFRRRLRKRLPSIEIVDTGAESQESADAYAEATADVAKRARIAADVIRRNADIRNAALSVLKSRAAKTPPTETPGA